MKPDEQEITNSVPIFDYQGLLERVGDDKELAKLVLDAFIDDIPKQIKILKENFINQDLETAVRQAHTIKGAAANVGAEQLRAIAAQMEESGNDIAKMSTYMPQIETDFEAVKTAILDL